MGSSFFSSRKFCGLLLLLGISIIAYLNIQYASFLNRQEYEAGLAAFDKALLITEDKLHSYVFGLQGVGGVYLTRNFQIIPEELRQYSHFGDNFESFHGAMGIGFIRHIRKNDYMSYVKQVQKKIPDFKVKRLSERQYDDLMVIESIEPIEKNAPARGLDVGSEAKRREAAIRAMESGQPAITDQIQLVQVDRSEPGFLYYLPMYKHGVVPPTLEERRQNIVGWTYAPILASAVGAHIRDSISTQIEFVIFEVGEGGQLKKLYGDVTGDKFEYNRKVQIGGRSWSFKANFQEDGLMRYRWILHVFGFGLMAGVYSFLCFLIRRLVLNREVTEIRAKNIEDQMQTLINGASFLIISTDATGKMLTVNRTALKLLGYSREELLSGKTPEIFHDRQEVIERAAFLSKEFHTTIHSNFDVFTFKAKLYKVDIQEWQYIRKDGSRFPVRLVVTPIFDKDNEIEGYLGIAEDITEIVHMRKVIEQQQQQIITSAKLSSLGEMAGGIAHEINNPLTIITSRLRLIQQKVLQQNIDQNRLIEELEKIEGTTLRIAKIVKGLKSFSRESSDDPKVQVEIAEIITETLDLCGEKFKNHEIDVRVSDAPKNPILCRPSQISQVLLNLLGNSFDAVESLDEKWIEISFEIKNDNLLIAVTDSGKGIPEYIVEKIMTPFFTTKEVGKGTGLGLSISKGILEEHGGTLVYDRQNPHTRFIVILPLFIR